MNHGYILDCALELDFAGQMDAAHNLIEKARRQMPTSGEILFAQGVWHQLEQQQEQALKSYQQAADLSWRWEVPYLAQGNLLRQTGPASRALEILDQAASLFASSPWPHWFRGLALMQDGTEGKEQAASEFVQSLKLAENQPNAYPALLVGSLQRNDCAGAMEIQTKMNALGFAGELDPSPWCKEGQKAASPPVLPD